MMAASSNEVEATITRLSSHRGVKGILILSSESGRVIRFTGSMLEDPAAGSAAAASAVNGDAIATPLEVTTNGDASHARQITGPVKRYADMVRRIVENSKQGVEEVDEQDKVKFLRIRTKNYELMITPEDKYTLVVFNDPSPA